jgi:hypothetical protein
MLPPLTFRLGAREDTPQIVALLNQIFRTPIDPETWDWFTYDNPYGESRVYLAEKAETRSLAGMFSFTPIRIKIQGTLIPASHGHHLVLTPAYRGGSAFIALSRYALQAESSCGTHLVMGLMNRNSYQAHKFLMKWNDFGFLDCLYKVSTRRQDHDCREIKAFGPEFDEFYHRLSPRFSFHCDKNADWMNWRFQRRPGAPYTSYVAERNREIEGYIILKRWQEPDGYRKAHIVDMHALSDVTLWELLAAAETYAADCNELNLWAIQRYPYRELLETAGFAEGAARAQPLAVRWLDGTSALFPEGNASYSYGDGDTVY